MPHTRTKKSKVADPPAVKRLRDALNSRNPVTVLTTLRDNADSLSSITSSQLPQLAFVCTEASNTNKTRTTAATFSAATKMSVYWSALLVIEMLSEGVPSIATEHFRNKDSAATAASNDDDQLSNFSLPPLADGFKKFAIAEGTASIYLRLLSLTVSSNSSNNNESGANAAAASSSTSSTSSSFVAAQNLEVAYRHLIQSLNNQHTQLIMMRDEQQHQQELAEASADTQQQQQQSVGVDPGSNALIKKAGVRRRFFAPVLATAAEIGLPKLCLEVLDSVADPNGLSGGMERLLSTSSQVFGERGAGDDDDDEASNAVVNESPDSNRIRQRDNNNNNDNDDNDDQQEQQQQQASSSLSVTPCELWECDFALMIDAVAKRVAITKSTAHENLGGIHLSQYVDRVISMLSVSIPLVGSKFRAAIASLHAAVASSSSPAAFSSHEATVRLPPAEQSVLTETSPCRCTHCTLAVGGPSLEMTREDAAQLAAVTRDRLILPKLRRTPTQRQLETVRVLLKQPQMTAQEFIQFAIDKFQRFEHRCKNELEPNMVVVDGANIGFFGLCAWYATAKRELLRRRGVPESRWDKDELDSGARRARGLHTDIAPDFASINAACEKARQFHFPGRRFAVVLHERHLTPRALDENGDNRRIYESWAPMNPSSSIVLVSSPAELNDDWCWMFMALTMCSRSYLTQADLNRVLSTPTTTTTATTTTQQTPTPIVIMTNDLMRDHITGLLPGKAEAGWKFLRFRWIHQVKCTSGTSNNPDEARSVRFKFPPRFHTWPLRTEKNMEIDDDGSNSSSSKKIVWHIPFTSAVLVQGTCKIGLPSGVTDNNSNNKTKHALSMTDQQQQQQQQSDATEKPCHLPEQLLDMLTFAGAESKKRLLCVSF